VAREARALMTDMSKLFPPGLEYTSLYDTTVFIDQSIDAVYETLFEAGILVLLVIMLFLQNARAMLVPATTVPVTIIGAFAAMAALGFTVNLMTLFALILAIAGIYGTVAYAASKFGVRGMTKIAALELGHRGVRVNSIHPGGINTVMGVAPGTPPEIIDQYYKAVPLQRIGQPVEVANVSLFLASDESSYVCGAEILADGGMLAGTYYPSLPGAPGS